MKRAARQRLAEMQLAGMLLTRLPMGRLAGAGPGLGAAAWAFPLIGAAVGLISGAAYLGASGLGLGAPLAALVATGAGLLATGALHEDGLADFCDGLGGGADRARKLEIMRDSRIGTYGALALIVALALRVLALADMPDARAGCAALVALATVSRTGAVLALAFLPPARADGLGAAAQGVPPAGLGAALLLGLLPLLLLPPAAAGLTLLACGVGAALPALLARRQIGGQTGDVLGAVQMGGELGGWLALAAQLGR